MLFSRATLIMFAMLLQVVLMVLLASYFSNAYLTIRIAFTLLAVIFIIALINRDMTAEAKLPWAIVILLFPLGFLLYLIFSHGRVSRKDRKLFGKLPQLKYAEETPGVPKPYVGQLQYLRNMGAPAFSDTYNKYFSSGEMFFEDLLAQLRKAQKYIFMEYFIIERGKMLDLILEVLVEKARAGVEVRLLYDDVGSIMRVNKNFARKLRKQGIKCVKFGKLRPIISSVYNNRDHRKITVIDGTIGYIGGINLADEYINRIRPFGYWKDTAVKMSGKCVSSLTLMFLQMFDMASGKVDDFDKYIQYTDNALSVHEIGIIAPFGDGPRPIYREEVGKNVYLNLINQAQHDLYITTPYLIVDDAFTEALQNAALRGVKVHIVTPGIPDKKIVFALTKKNCAKLIAKGVNIYKYTPGFVHAKSIIADGTAGVVGTINLDFRSFVHHYECGVYMYSTSALSELYDDVKRLVKESEQYTGKPKLALWEKIAVLFANIVRPLM